MEGKVLKMTEVLYLPLVQEFYELHTVEPGRILMANITFIFSLLTPIPKYYDCYSWFFTSGKVSGRRAILQKGQLWKIPDVYPQAMSERHS